MCFVPGSHRMEVLPHRNLDGDPRLHLLEVDAPVDTSSAVEVPLRVGGATFHHPRTLHSTAANQTDRPRRAFANEFQTRPARRPAPLAGRAEAGLGGARSRRGSGKVRVTARGGRLAAFGSRGQSQP